MIKTNAGIRVPGLLGGYPFMFSVSEYVYIYIYMYVLYSARVPGVERVLYRGALTQEPNAQAL